MKNVVFCVVERRCDMIEVKHVSKTFKILKRKEGLKETLKAFFKREYKYVHAVDDIHLPLKKAR